MKFIPTECFGDETELRNGDDWLPGERSRRREPLPPLPEDCRPLPAIRSASLAADPEPLKEHSFAILLRSLVGRTVTLVDPESFEEVAVGHRIRAAIHQAQLVRMGDDYLVLIGEFAHRSVGHPSGGAKGSIRHYIPLSKIKRISILEDQPILHL